MSDQMKRTATSLYNHMQDLQGGRITPDQYRAFVKEQRPSFTADEWQQIQFAAVAADSRK